MSALVAAAFRRRRVAGELLSDVVLRGTAARGGGFVSGHAATSTALVAVAVRAP
jgi:membrane-associated phospholipid phosphatase